jgi:Histidine phosphatase superfamily (branch 1)
MNETESKRVSLIASHNSRIQCFLDKFKETEKQVRFKNCAVLRMELVPLNAPETQVNISMVYPGELEVKEQQKNKMYYTNLSAVQSGVGDSEDVIRIESNITRSENCENTRSCPISLKKMFQKKKQKGIQEVEFTDIKTRIDERDLQNLLNLKPEDLDRTTYVFYIVRHGQAEHNVYPAVQLIRKKDTSLTESVGHRQAINAGIALAEIMQMYNDNTVNYTFCSDLLRTRQTLLDIYKGIQSTNVNIELPSKMVVLPCANELSYFKNANCDRLTSKEAGARFAAENFPGCDMKQIQDTGGSCIQIKDVDTGLTMEIDWSFYTPFYGNAFRNTIGKTETMRCRDTTMIAMAVKYISQDFRPLNKFVEDRKTTSENSKGGRRTTKRNRRKTGKTQKKRKTRKIANRKNRK